MNYSGIKYPDVANGPGCRVSLFVSGCSLNCPGCFNKSEQSFDYGAPYTEDIKKEVLERLNFPWVKGLSILGGDPLEPKNQKEVSFLILEAKRQNPDKEIWLWTGRVYPNIPQTEYLQDILDNVDILIDGPFIMDLKDLNLEWRGSSNQRILTKQDREKLNKEEDA